MHNDHGAGFAAAPRRYFGDHRREQATNERLGAVWRCADHHRCGLAEALHELARDVLYRGGISLSDLRPGHQLPVKKGHNGLNGCTVDGCLLGVISTGRCPHCPLGTDVDSKPVCHFAPRLSCNSI